jgi:hypothetical protein
MARRNPPPRPPRVVRLGTAAVVVALGAAVVVALSGALTPPIARAEPAPDLARARELYRSAEAAMRDGRYDDAARDYGAAYEVSADPALFYKIGRASERAGKCDVALIYYARYLREGKPTEPFTALTRERIAACGGDRAGSGSTGAGSDATGSAGGAAAGPAAGTGTTATRDGTGRASSSSAGDATGASSSASPGPAGAAHGGPASAHAGSSPPGASPGSAGGAATSTGATGAEGSAAPPEGPAVAGPAAGSGSAAAALIPPTREKVAWLMGGGAIALVTLGGVLAYAASSSENDVRDLYAGFAGQPPMFDAQTRKRYDDLVDQGRRYQHLSWAAFGLAGAAAVGVAVLFTVGRGDEPAPPRAPAVTPVVGPRGAGVSVRF